MKKHGRSIHIMKENRYSKGKNNATNSLSPTCSDMRAIRLLDTVHRLYAAAELDWSKPSVRARIP